MSRKSLFASLILSTCIASAAQAASPLVHLPLDGSADNLGSAGAAKIYTPGEADTPTFVQGHFGDALSFGKGGVVAIPYMFDPKEHPQATVTMWIRVDTDQPYEREVFSLGPGSGLRMTLGGNEKATMRSSVTAAHDKAIPVGRWVFVAGVVDNAAGTIRIYQDDDVFEATGLSLKTPGNLAVAAPGEEEKLNYIFIGADDFNSGAKEVRPIALDDVRLYDVALSETELNSIRYTGPSNDDEPEAALAEAEDTPSPSTQASLSNDVKRTDESSDMDDGEPDTVGEFVEDATNGIVTDIFGSDFANLSIVKDKLAPALGKAVDDANDGDATIIKHDGSTVDGPEVVDMTDTETDLGSIINNNLINKSKEETANTTDPAETETETEPEAETSSSWGQALQPAGPALLSGISGKASDNIERIEFPHQFFKSITWGEKTDRPCAIRIGIGPDSKTWDRCESNRSKLSDPDGSVAIGRGAGIGRIDICKSSMSDRMKGIKIYGNSWTPDENGNYAPYASTDYLPNCGTWQRAVLCPANTFATGLVIHSENTSGDVKSITGLQLICRAKA